MYEYKDGETVMRQEILQDLRQITPEEQRILSGASGIEKGIYMSSEDNRIDARKLLEEGKLIQVRTHTRFVHFPEHTHNYIEVVYMCSGRTHHKINGEDVWLNQGELLFLNQKATQEIYPAGEDDIAVNLIILPEFLDYGLNMIGTEENLLRDFMVDCLCGAPGSSGYLHFKVADVLPIQNLIENLIWTIRNHQSNKRSINQVTMGLLFLQLLNHMDRVETDSKSGQQRLILNVLSYIEEHYTDGELTQLAAELHYDVCWLSKEIRKRTGRNYTELIQTRRLSQATYLLTNTSKSVIEIAMEVGYDNISYFHRIFYKKYGMTPRNYRLKKSED